MIAFILVDLDDTILDFKKQEEVAIRKTLADAGVDPTEETCARYSQINEDHWKRLERGELTRAQVLRGRFEVLFRELGVQVDAEKAAAAYMENLSVGHYFLPGAKETVAELSKKYKLYLASNGTASVQQRRLESAGILPYFRDVFISQNIGANKPAKAYFDYCFAHIPGFDREKTIIVGDSLSSDIQGGIAAGITTCWVNLHNKPANPDICPDYTIESITQLEALLENL